LQEKATLIPGHQGKIGGGKNAQGKPSGPSDLIFLKLIDTGESKGKQARCYVLSRTARIQSWIIARANGKCCGEFSRVGKKLRYGFL